MVRALALLYEATGGGAWRNNLKWLSGEPCVDGWFGVHCCPQALPVLRGDDECTADGGGATGVLTTQGSAACHSGSVTGTARDLATCVVVKVLLPSNNLIGSLDGALCELPFLQHLDLSGNALTGSLPSAADCLPRLTYLDLTQTRSWDDEGGVTGPVPEWLLDRLRSLAPLRLANNALDDPTTAESAVAISRLWQRCQTLGAEQCSGVPPIGCSAFNRQGQRYEVELDGLGCVRCPTPLEIFGIAGGMAGIVLLLMLLVFVYTRFVRKYPEHAKTHVATIMILVGHLQTLTIIGSLQLGWPLIIQQILASINLPFMSYIPVPCILTDPVLKALLSYVETAVVLLPLVGAWLVAWRRREAATRAEDKRVEAQSALEAAELEEARRREAVKREEVQQVLEAETIAVADAAKDAAKAKAAAVKADAAAAEADDFLSVLFSFLFSVGLRASLALFKRYDADQTRLIIARSLVWLLPLFWLFLLRRFRRLLREARVTAKKAAAAKAKVAAAEAERAARAARAVEAARAARAARAEAVRLQKEARRAAEAVRYLTERYRSDNGMGGARWPLRSQWQLVVWARQGLLFLVSFAMDCVMWRSPYEAHQTARGVFAALAIAVLGGFWWLQAQRQPYAMRLQHRLEAFLYTVDILAIILACVYGTLTHDGAVQDGSVRLAFEGGLGALLGASVLGAALVVYVGWRRERELIREWVPPDLPSIDAPIVTAIRDGTVRLIDIDWLLDSRCSDGQLPRVTKVVARLASNEPRCVLIRRLATHCGTSSICITVEAASAASPSPPPSPPEVAAVEGSVEGLRKFTLGELEQWLEDAAGVTLTVLQAKKMKVFLNASPSGTGIGSVEGLRKFTFGELEQWLEDGAGVTLDVRQAKKLRAFLNASPSGTELVAIRTVVSERTNASPAQSSMALAPQSSAPLASEPPLQRYAIGSSVYVKRSDGEENLAYVKGYKVEKALYTVEHERLGSGKVFMCRDNDLRAAFMIDSALAASKVLIDWVPAAILPFRARDDSLPPLPLQPQRSLSAERNESARDQTKPMPGRPTLNGSPPPPKVATSALVPQRSLSAEHYSALPSSDPDTVAVTASADSPVRPQWRWWWWTPPSPPEAAPLAGIELEDRSSAGHTPRHIPSAGHMTTVVVTFHLSTFDEVAPLTAAGLSRKAEAVKERLNKLGAEDIKIVTGKPFLPRCQDMPPNAFLSLERAAALFKRQRRGVRVLSYCWRMVGMADPDGYTLEKIRRSLEVMRGGDGDRGLFVDFACLPQLFALPSWHAPEAISRRFGAEVREGPLTVLKFEWERVATEDEAQVCVDRLIALCEQQRWELASIADFESLGLRSRGHVGVLFHGCYVTGEYRFDERVSAEEKEKENHYVHRLYRYLRGVYHFDDAVSAEGYVRFRNAGDADAARRHPDLKRMCGGKEPQLMGEHVFENELKFKRGLSVMGSLYASATGTCVLQLTDPPGKLDHDGAPSELVSERTGTVFVVSLRDESLEEPARRRWLEELHEELGDGVLAWEKGPWDAVVVRVDDETAARAVRSLEEGGYSLRRKDRKVLPMYNLRPYRSRGWPTFETSAASIMLAHLTQRKRRGLALSDELKQAEKSGPKLINIDVIGAPRVVEVLQSPERLLRECKKLLLSKQIFFTAGGGADRKHVVQLLFDFEDMIAVEVDRKRAKHLNLLTADLERAHATGLGEARRSRSRKLLQRLTFH